MVSNISSMNAYQGMLNTSADNVAKISVSNSAVENSNTDLAKEMTNQIVAVDGAKADASAIKTQDSMMGTLLDIKA